MSSWKAGHDDIAALVDRGHLERISGQSANGAYLITQAQQRLAGARAALRCAPTESLCVEPPRVRLHRGLCSTCFALIF